MCLNQACNCLVMRNKGTYKNAICHRIYYSDYSALDMQTHKIEQLPGTFLPFYLRTLSDIKSQLISSVLSSLSAYIIM